MPSDDSPPDATPPSPQEPHDPDRQTHSTHTFNVPYRSAFHPKPPEETPREPPKVTPIPKITSSSASSPDGSTHQSPASLAEGLVSKYVDEFGNILEWNGTVLGRAEGDLPSMVGRAVSETGEILDADGEVAGHVSENYARPPPLEELEGGLRVDNAGNIYSQDGEVVGKLNEKPSTKEKKEEEGKPSSSSGHAGASGSNKCSCNAPKPSAAPSPSEIYLDVKSTFDGIQLIIKIPTVFNREDGESDKKEE
jgi:hypothetical protein